MNLGSQGGQEPVVVRRTEKLGEREREREALFPSEGRGQGDDDDDYCTTTREKCVSIFLKITGISSF